MSQYIKSFEDFLNEADDYESGHNERGRDLSKEANSLTARLTPLVGRMQRMPLDQLKKEFLDIVNDPTLHASEATRKKWNLKAAEIRTAVQLQFIISNIVLKGSKLGVNEDYSLPASQAIPYIVRKTSYVSQPVIFIFLEDLIEILPTNTIDTIIENADEDRLNFQILTYNSAGKYIGHLGDSTGGIEHDAQVALDSIPLLLGKQVRFPCMVGVINLYNDYTG